MEIEKIRKAKKTINELIIRAFEVSKTTDSFEVKVYDSEGSSQVVKVVGLCDRSLIFEDRFNKEIKSMMNVDNIKYVENIDGTLILKEEE